MLIYTDGSVLVSHGGMEMGQGLHTKVIQIASRCLGIDATRIHIQDAATDKVKLTFSVPSPRLSADSKRLSNGSLDGQ